MSDFQFSLSRWKRQQVTTWFVSPCESPSHELWCHQECSPHLARMLLTSHTQFFWLWLLLHSLYTFLTILSLSIWSRWIQNIIMCTWWASNTSSEAVPWGCFLLANSQKVSISLVLHLLWVSFGAESWPHRCTIVQHGNYQWVKNLLRDIMRCASNFHSPARIQWKKD